MVAMRARPFFLKSISSYIAVYSAVKLNVVLPASPGRRVAPQRQGRARPDAARCGGFRKRFRNRFLFVILLLY
jgi:hypothetical protein